MSCNNAAGVTSNADGRNDTEAEGTLWCRVLITIAPQELHISETQPLLRGKHNNHRRTKATEEV